MKQLLVSLALLGLAAAQAENAPGAAAERTRLATERAQVQAAFTDQEKACYGKFGVTDCLAAAKARRRQTLADLRRQEIALNDAERKRKAAERQQLLDERLVAEKERLNKERANQAGQQQGREERAAQKAAAQASNEAAAPGNAAKREERVRQKLADRKAAQARRSKDAEKSDAQHEQRQKDAQKRRDNLSKRLAERKKPAAQPLPVPP